MFVEVYINSCFWNGKLAEMQKANFQEKKKSIWNIYWPALKAWFITCFSKL